MHIRFGVNFMPSAPVLEVVEWARAVERHGYDLLGISDSQSISRDVYVTLGHCATADDQHAAPRHRLEQPSFARRAERHAGTPPGLEPT